MGKGNLGELLCRVPCRLGFYGDWITFQAVFGQSLCQCVSCNSSMNLNERKLWRKQTASTTTVWAQLSQHRGSHRILHLRLLVLSPSRLPNRIHDSYASLELSTANIHAAKLLLVLKPGVYLPPALTSATELVPKIHPRSSHRPCPCLCAYIAVLCIHLQTHSWACAHFWHEQSPLPALVPQCIPRSNAEDHNSYVSIH